MLNSLYTRNILEPFVHYIELNERKNPFQNPPTTRCRLFANATDVAAHADCVLLPRSICLGTRESNAHTREICAGTIHNARGVNGDRIGRHTKAPRATDLCERDQRAAATFCAALYVYA